MADNEYYIPNDDSVSASDIQPVADLSNADLSHADLSGADLSDTNLGATNLSGADLCEADLADADLGGSDLTEADLTEADLTDADLPYTDLTNVDFTDADLLCSNLREADLRSTDLTNADLSDANLVFADLTDAHLHGTDFTDANLVFANLSYAHLYNTNLSDATLERTRLIGAKLEHVDLTDADLSEADFSGTKLQSSELRKAQILPTKLIGAKLGGADLSDQDLSGVNLSRADLREVSMAGMTANQGTTVGRMCTDLSSPDEYDRLAQGYHELKDALSEEGLSQRARQARALEQQARTAEAWGRFKRQSRERLSKLRILAGWRQSVSPPWPGPEVRTQFLSAVGGTLSRYLTGYGTRPLYVLLWTAGIILVTTVLFTLGSAPSGDGWEGGPLYYSVVTFVTAPPHPPSGVGIVTRAAVLLETYIGTALIVLLGYVLGTREQV
jgi:uncharacterized protein YjbI with pentapeptide repeats